MGQSIYGFDPKFGSYQGPTFLQQIAASLGVGLGNFNDELYPAARLDAMCKAPPASATLEALDSSRALLPHHPKD